MQLTILAMSDTHGYFFPTDYVDDRIESPFGLLKAASVIKKERERANGPVLLLDNGDFIQGSPMSQYVEENNETPAQLVDILNDLKVDAGVIGNHEFNYGVDYLKAGIEVVSHPVLSANILQKNGAFFANAPAKIFEKDGLKIGVLGLTTQYIPNWEHPENIKDLEFHSAVAVAKEWVPKLQEEVDVVVVAYHGGFESDLDTGEPTEPHNGENEAYQLLKEVSGIDALITGHQHREIARVIDGVPIIQPGNRASNIGKITLDFEKVEDQYQLVEVNSELVPVKDAPVHPELAEKYRPLQEEVNSWLDQVIGETTGDMRILDHHEARLQEHPYVEFINRVQLHHSKAQISGTALFSNTAPGYPEEITIREVILNYPYPNTLAVIEVTGAELKEALEKSAEYFAVIAANEIGVNPDFVTPKPKPYNYDMYEGIEYVIDVSKPFGERITTLQFEGVDVQPTDTFELVTNQYRAVGGGKFEMFKDKPFLREINTSMSDLITAYIKEHKVISAEVDQNFKVIRSK